VRIVAGKHKGRKILSPEGTDIRPTLDRTRESLFNIIEHGNLGTGSISPLRGACVLDAFCGTGALGLEALSRGAANVTFMDNDRRALALCRQNIMTMGETEASQVLRGDCLKPSRAANASDLVFTDAPYDRDLTAEGITALSAAGWIREGGLCVLETGSDETVKLPNIFEPLEDRKYGAARIHFFRFLSMG